MRFGDSAVLGDTTAFGDSVRFADADDVDVSVAFDDRSVCDD